MSNENCILSNLNKYSAERMKYRNCRWPLGSPQCILVSFSSKLACLPIKVTFLHLKKKSVCPESLETFLIVICNPCIPLTFDIMRSRETAERGQGMCTGHTGVGVQRTQSRAHSHRHVLTPCQLKAKVSVLRSTTQGNQVC